MLRFASLIYQNESIPFHSIDESPESPAGTQDGFALLPVGGDVTVANILQRMDEVIALLYQMMLGAPNPKSQQKFESARTWLRRDVRPPWEQIHFRAKTAKLFE